MQCGCQLLVRQARGVGLRRHAMWALTRLCTAPGCRIARGGGGDLCGVSRAAFGLTAHGGENANAHSGLIAAILVAIVRPGVRCEDGDCCLPTVGEWFGRLAPTLKSA
jgi:hypothetical protein